MVFKVMPMVDATMKVMEIMLTTCRDETEVKNLKNRNIYTFAAKDVCGFSIRSHKNLW